MYLCLSVYGVVMPQVTLCLGVLGGDGGEIEVCHMSHLCLRFDCIVCSWEGIPFCGKACCSLPSIHSRASAGKEHF